MEFEALMRFIVLFVEVQGDFVLVCYYSVLCLSLFTTFVEKPSESNR